MPNIEQRKIDKKKITIIAALAFLLLFALLMGVLALCGVFNKHPNTDNSPKITLAFDSNGGTGTYQNMTVKLNEDKTYAFTETERVAITNAFSKDEYDLVGLSLTETGEGAWTISFAGIEEQPVTLYAIWVNWNTIFTHEDGVITGLTEYGKTLSTITIPSVIKGESITSIASNAFFGCDNLTDVTISKGITSIESRAFDYCANLTNVTIPESVTSIGSCAFRACGLTSVTIPSSVTTFGSGIFINCTALTSATLPEGITKIASSMFEGCSSLSNIEIPTSVTTIGNFAFKGCSSLTGVTIPEGVTTIEDSAFKGCSGLVSVDLPTSITNLAYGIFLNCPLLEKINIYSIKNWCGIKYSGGGNIFGNLEGDTDLYLNDEKITDLVIPDDVTSISYLAFSNCKSITSVIIPKTVTAIGNNAFYNCTNLTNAKILANIIELNGSMFRQCSSLQSVVLPNSITTIGNMVFYECTNLTAIYYEGTSEQWDAILINTYGNNNLISPESTTIKYYYSENTPATPNASGSAFDDNYWHYENGSIAVWDFFAEVLAYSGSAVTGLTDFGKTMYANLDIFFTITIPNKIKDNEITSIAENAFRDNDHLWIVIIQEGITSIGDFAFYNCEKFGIIVIPTTMQSFGQSAFYNGGYHWDVCLSEGMTEANFENIDCADTENPLKDATILCYNGSAYGGSDDEYCWFYDNNGLPVPIDTAE